MDGRKFSHFTQDDESEVTIFLDDGKYSHYTQDVESETNDEKFSYNSQDTGSRTSDEKFSYNSQDTGSRKSISKSRKKDSRKSNGTKVSGSKWKIVREQFFGTSSEVLTPAAVVREMQKRVSARIRLQKEGSKIVDCYWPVTKWHVDYTNKNFIRSKMNKPTGHHRLNSPPASPWKISYDNKYFLKSRVNKFKGLHRRIPAVERKFVPDDDILADRTGWELEYGPEFFQKEEDVPFVLEEVGVVRGSYRFHGVDRNNSDIDITLRPDKKVEEDDSYATQTQSGTEFYQRDAPLINKDKKVTKGGFRYNDAERNRNDDSLLDVRELAHWKIHKKETHEQVLKSEHDVDKEVEPVVKGIPFKRTKIKRIYEFKPRLVDSKHATYICLTPGEGEQTFYIGQPRVSYTSVEKYFGDSHPQKKMKEIAQRNREKRISRDQKKTQHEVHRNHEKRISRDEKKIKQEVYHDDYEERMSRHEKHAHLDSEKLPPRLQRRITKLHNKAVSKDKFERLKQHESNPDDYGFVHNERFEEYNAENQSEAWLATEQKFTKIYHK